jgi:hypothetical protein
MLEYSPLGHSLYLTSPGLLADTGKTADQLLKLLELEAFAQEEQAMGA